MRIQGVARVSDFLGDLIIYRRLEPADRRVPGLSLLAGEVGLENHSLPRKADRAYARVVAHILEAARAIDGTRATLRQVLYIGDSPGLDVKAFTNLVQESAWAGWAFIGMDNPVESPAMITEGNVCRGNRWSILGEFLKWAKGQGARLDASLAVVVDLDKTALGPRGRNDSTIDEARTDAAIRMARRALGQDFGIGSFENIYRELYQPRYHFFTEDNQDFLVYSSLMSAAGLYPFATLLQDLERGQIRTFADFLNAMDGRMSEIGSPGLWAIHQEVADNFRAGDPTPFKSFRREEFLTTTERMGAAPAGEDVDTLLRTRITINSEVAQVVRHLKARGALASGLSDKPDEAVFPSAQLAESGYKPLHQKETLEVGEVLNPEQM
jgi:hypothetical protein